MGNGPIYRAQHGNPLKRDWRDIWWTRQERIKREGSPYYTWLVPATIAGARSAINIAQQFPEAKKYEPLDWFEIANNGAVDITVFMNGNTESLPIPAGTIRAVGNKSIWHLQIQNDDAVAASVLNLITVSLRKEPKTIDKWAREH